MEMKSKHCFFFSIAGGVQKVPKTLFYEKTIPYHSWIKFQSKRIVESKIQQTGNLELVNFYAVGQSFLNLHKLHTKGKYQAKCKSSLVIFI